VKARLEEVGLWNSQEGKPDFGWFPVLCGWHIAVYDEERMVRINGIPWDMRIDIPWGGYSPYAAAAHNFLA